MTLIGIHFRFLEVGSRISGLRVIILSGMQTICAKGAQYLYRLGLIQYYMLSYLQVRFTITFDCYGTIANIQSKSGLEENPKPRTGVIGYNNT